MRKTIITSDSRAPGPKHSSRMKVRTTCDCAMLCGPLPTYTSRHCDAVLPHLSVRNASEWQLARRGGLWLCGSLLAYIHPASLRCRRSRCCIDLTH